MLILSLETSCDETAAALVRDGMEILSQTTASSEELHKKTGGIVPEVAAREQVRCVIPVVKETLAAALIESSAIDALAVTYGPGLIGSLLIGVETAKSLSYAWKKPLIPVNHLIGHIYANFIGKQITAKNQQLTFPAICLVVSGGHTELVLMRGHRDLKWVGGTRDDAAGECFDKVARILGLGYPGGPAIARAAGKHLHSHPELVSGPSPSKSKGFRNRFGMTAKLPRPLINSNDYDLSFSGLKTAVLREVRRGSSLSGKEAGRLSYEFQEAVTDVLVEKTLKAARDFRVKSILLSGGVAANQCLREKFGKYAGNFAVFIPPVSLCTDNAAIIASAAFFDYKPVSWQKVAADPGLGIGD